MSRKPQNLFVLIESINNQKLDIKKEKIFKCKKNSEVGLKEET